MHEICRIYRVKPGKFFDSGNFVWINHITRFPGNFINGKNFDEFTDF